tara:strand:+ start:3313 stop:3600 length:288 start_codon:yes stop_codon:yes gene_type:complete
MTEIESTKKVACILGVLPILMDFMEDIKYDYPDLYRRKIKKSGNEFIEEVEKLSNHVYKLIEENPEIITDSFSQQVIHIGETFKQFINEIKTKKK